MVSSDERVQIALTVRSLSTKKSHTQNRTHEKKTDRIGCDHGVDDDVRTVHEDAEYAMDASFRIGDIDGTYFGRYRQGFE